MRKRFPFVALCCAALVAALLAAWLTHGSSNPFYAPTGVWSVLPPIVAVVLAFATKNVLLSLSCGVISGAYLLALQAGDGGLVGVAIDSFEIATQKALESVSDSWNAGILLQCGAIGGMIALVAKSGGAAAVARIVANRARGPASSQIVAWFLGFFIFFDDYANVQIRGPIMRPITDRRRVSREKLAFILDSTAAPIAGIALISTWIGTEVSYIREGLSAAGVEDVAPYALFVQTIPHRFYNILTLFFVLLTAIALREFGPMRKAETLARRGFLREMDSSLVKIEDVEAAETAVDADVASSGRRALLPDWTFAAIPLLVLIVSAFGFFYSSGASAIVATGDATQIAALKTPLAFGSLQTVFGEADASISIFRAALLSGIVAFIMCVACGKTTAAEAAQIWLDGVKSLAFTFVILILAWTLSSCIGKNGLGAAKFLVGALSNDVPAFILPTLIFVLAAIVSFATGTSYGTMAIITPLAIPFAVELAPGDSQFLVASTAAVLTGAIFGDHSSPISDTTILSATSARCGPLEHVGTQIRYALVIAALSVCCGFIPVGLGASIWIALPIGLLAVVAVVYIFGKKIPNEPNVIDEVKK